MGDKISSMAKATIGVIKERRAKTPITDAMIIIGSDCVATKADPDIATVKNMARLSHIESKANNEEGTDRLVTTPRGSKRWYFLALHVI